MIKGTVGGNIECNFGSRYGKIWLCTATSLDVIGNPPVSIIDGKELTDFGVLTSEHNLHKAVCGPLKENIIQGFPDLIGTNVAVIQYYLLNVVPVDGKFHVHVHRGSRMGLEHIAQIKKRLGGEMDPRLEFGFGYYPNELACTPCDVYYSISLIVGFDPNFKSGTTFIPSLYLDGDKKLEGENHLLGTVSKILDNYVSHVSISRLTEIFIPN